MGFFDRHKALIITILSMCIFLLLLYNIKLNSSNKEIAGTLVELQHYELEEAPEQEEAPEPEEQPQESRTPDPSSVRTHQAFDQNREAQEQNFDDRLNEIFEKNAARQTASEAESSDPAEGEFNVRQPIEEEVQQRSDGDDSSSEISTDRGSIRNSSISFSLVGRAGRHIPNPVYTCDVSGKIVVNIVVNSLGEVTKTSINKAASTSTNQCLIDRAQEYASRASFSELPGRDSQIGSITYFFQG